MLELRSAYPLENENVHLLNARAGATYTFECRRCHRTLPEGQFECLGSVKGAWRNVTSCMALHPLCWTCRKQARGAWVKHPEYTMALDRFFTKLVGLARGGAKARGLLFAVTKDDLLGLYLESNGRCALTGEKMDWRAKGRKGRNGAALTAPSVDRIDSRGNYVLGNVQLVLVAVNLMKRDMSQEAFVEICRRVAEQGMFGSVSAA